MSGELTTFIGIIGVGLSIGTFFIGRTTASRKDGVEAGAMAENVKHIKETTDRLETRFHDDLQATNGRIDEQTKNANNANVVAATALDVARSAHHRITEHLQREHDMPPVRDNFTNK